MEAPYHVLVLRRALGSKVSARAMQAIIDANLGQDSWIGLLHPTYHFDNSLFAESLAYIEQCRTEAAKAKAQPAAWAAFGRLSHAAADFYSHSNYVALWRAAQPGPGEPPAEAIDGLDPAYLKHPGLVSGRIYFADVLYLLPSLRPWIRTWAPPDSHAVMNLDSPERGPLFPYSIEAAVQRTFAEFERTLAAMAEEQGEPAVWDFCDQG